MEFESMETQQNQQNQLNQSQSQKDCIGRTHMAPSEYKYLLKCYVESEFVTLVQNYCNHNFIGNIVTPNGCPYILNGYNKVDDTDIWVINQEKQGYYYLWFKTRSDAKMLYNYVYDIKNSKQNAVKNPIYKFTKNGWQLLNIYSGRKVEDLIGYKSYLDTINKDLLNYTKYLNFLKEIGEGHRTLNYLLYGPPGTGKTTIIRTLATMHNLPIYIVNPTLMDNVSASAVLNPKVSNSNTSRIVLFEDFDRYLKEGKYSMSEILNELDGIESTEGCIRFFSCNDVKEIYKHDALINRMSAKFEFYYPTIEDFKNKLNRFLTYWTNIDKEKANAFINLLNERNIQAEIKLTLRPFANYIIRYLFDENCLDQMIENINELI
jgi:AAA+ superfamily predicted ATPase